jgi:AcrR family transcriptional regulator
VLAAAEEVLSKQGLDAPIDEIAHHAGVGVGTVYRHFPTKRELHEAVVHAHFDQLINIVEELLNSPDPGEAFFEYVDAVVRESAHKAVARAIAESDPEVRRRREEWMSALTQRSAELLRRSQNVGTIRKDVTYEDVRVVLGGLCMAYDRLALDPIQRDRSVALLRAALTDTKTPIG